jgi:hypothetical protein
MATTGFSSANYHRVADHADFTLPDGDWFELIIFRPDDIASTQVILSSGEPYSANTRHLIQFDDSLELIVDGTDGTLISGLSSGTWYLVCLQRSSGNMQVRMVPMGTTSVSSGGIVALTGAQNSTSEQRVGRSGGATASPLNGAVSDWIFVPGETISNADLQAIATGTAIDSFAWYSSTTFWAILENSTNTDHIGGKTITENGTLSSAADPGDLVRFGAVEIGQVTESDTVFGFTALKSAAISQVNESDTAQLANAVISANVGLVLETDAAQSVFGRKLGSIGMVAESDQAQSASPILSAAIGLTSETAESFQMSTGADVPISPVTETDFAQTVKPERTLIGQVSETNQAQPFGHIIFQTIGQIGETDLAQTLSAGAGIDIGIVTEADQPQSFVPVKPIVLPIGLIAESDQALAAAFNSPIGLVTETDIALGFTLSEFVTILPTNAASNIYFVVDNRLDDADTLAATSTAAGFDVDNLKLEQKLKVWRSVDLSVQTITLTWTEPENISAVGIAFSNLTRGASVRNKLYTNVADSSPVFDTGNQSVDYSYGPPKGFFTIGLSSFAFGGGTYFSSLFDTAQAKKLEIIISNATNPDGYIEISRIVVGKAFTPAVGASYGAAVAHDDASSSLRTDAGELVSSRGAMNKKLPFTLGMMLPNDRREFFEMLRRNGKTSPVFLSLYENAVNPEERQSHIIYGVIDELPSVPIQNFNIYNSTIQITEI